MREAVVAFGVALAFALPGFAGAAEPTLPNLVPLAPYDVRVARADGGTGLALRFSITAQNLSPYALEVLGAPPRDAERTAAQQCVAWQARACTQRRDAGDLRFHAEHGHWHFDDYALYELRALTPEDEPDMTEAGLVAAGVKASFCLMDTASTSSAPGALDDPFFFTGFYAGCSVVLQGISPGWSDVYDWPLPGQQIDIAGVADGRYGLVVTLDPTARLAETTRDDNVAVTTIQIAGRGSVAFEV